MKPALNLLFVFVMVTGITLPGYAQDTLAIAPERFWLSGGGFDGYIPYATSEPFLNESLPHVDRALIAIHQGDRDAVRLGVIVTEAVQGMGAAGRTLIVAPQYLAPQDVIDNPWLDPGVLAWGEDWFYNGYSDAPGLQGVRSFIFVDRMIEAVIDACPNLEVVVLSGHAGGGKYVNRYAMVSPIVDEHPTVEFLFQAANLGGYAYFTPERWDPDVEQFLTPAQGLDTTGCSLYDRWPFGLTGVPNAQELRDAYRTRNVALMIGVEDTGMRSPNCQMYFQTPDFNRLQMADLFWEHSLRTFGGVPQRHLYFRVENAGHAIAPFYNKLQTRHLLVNFLQEHVLFTQPLQDEITLPQEGGSFDLRVAVMNSGYAEQTLDSWTELIRPDGSTISPVQQAQLSLEAGEARTLPELLTVTLPADAPPGTWTHRARIGSYPDQILAESSVQFVKRSNGLPYDRTAASANNDPWNETQAAIPSNDLPANSFALLLPHPNPFNEQTTIQVSLPETATLSLDIFSLTGRRVSTLAEHPMPAGRHEFSLDLGGHAGGIYFVSARANGQLIAVRKLMLVR